MKPNELMVGDYVIVKTPIEEKTAKVAEIYPKGIITEDGGPYLEDEIIPVPITPEILEKNGFEKDDGGEECWGCDAGWVIPGEYDECGKEKSWQVEILGEPNSFTGTIYFIHELQHALRLCGIEKEVVL